MAIGQLPPNARLRAWEFSASRGRFDQVLLGSRFGYVRGSAVYMGGADPLFTGVAQAGSFSADDQQYDAQTYVLCFDLASGKRLWSCRFSGPFAYVLDPRDDRLWAVGRRVYCLDPANGQTLVQQQGAAQVGQVRQFQFGRQFVTSTPYGMRYSELNSPIPTYNVDTGAVTNEIYRRDERLAPTGLRKVVMDVTQSPQDVTSTIRCVPLTGGNADWTYSVPGYCTNHPCWIGKDVLILSGTDYSRAAVTCLDGQTGRARWTTTLSHGAYNIESHANGDLGHNWEPIGLLGGYLAAITDDGAVWFLDHDTGEPKHRLLSTQVHVAMPKVVGNNLVIAGRETISSIPLDMVFQSLSQDEATLLQQKAELLLKAGSPSEARKISALLAKAVPERASVWSQHARIADLLGKDSDAVFAECRAMQIGNISESQRLRDRYGLLCRVPTGPITADLVHMGLFVYAGTQDGLLLRVNARTLSIVDTEQCPINIAALRVRDGALCRYGEDRHSVEVARVAGAVMQSSDVEPDPKQMPREWNTRSGYDGPAVHYQGKYYRPLHQGKICVTDGVTVSEHASPFTDIESWAILLTPAGPLGYGTGGVYTLDQNLCPKDRLIDVGIEPLNRRRNRVTLMSSDQRTLALVVAGPTSVLQVWSADGKQKIRDVEVITTEDRPSSRLRAVSDGYLFAGGELAWVPSQTDRPVWRFRFAQEADGNSAASTSARFGVPLIVEQRLWCAEAAGGICVFDLSAVTSPQKNKPRP